MNLLAIGDNIRILRKSAGLTQQKLAEKLNISCQAISKWENGYCLPETQLLPKLADVLHTSIDNILMYNSNILKGDLTMQKTVVIEPKIIRKGELIIGGLMGDGAKTGELWNEYEEISDKSPLKNKMEEYGYEIRLYDGSNCDCFVGVRVSSDVVVSPFKTLKLPDVLYAVFEIYPYMGYESQNQAMDKWLIENKEKYQQLKLNGKDYIVEFYDERFKGNEDADSVVEIWIPIIKL